MNEHRDQKPLFIIVRVNSVQNGFQLLLAPKPALIVELYKAQNIILCFLQYRRFTGITLR